jgi:hypothetical protein
MKVIQKETAATRKNQSGPKKQQLINQPSSGQAGTDANGVTNITNIIYNFNMT